VVAVLGLLIVALGGDSGPRRFGLDQVGFDRLSGWADDHVSAAIPAFLKSCARFLTRPNTAAFDATAMSADFGRVGDWQALCHAAEVLPPGDDATARRFFETGFVPLAVSDYGTAEGLFTGYFEIELHGSYRRHGRYQTPIYRRPPDLLGSKPQPTRAEIEDGALAGRGLELLWVDDPIDAFFLQMQGSGRVRLGSGLTIRIGYAGQNGRPYVPVGRLLIERGLIPRQQLTMTSIRAWMRQHPAAGAALRREDPSYVFFREVRGDGPVGAEGAVLTAERTLAVDRALIALGTPIWLDAKERFAHADELRRLVVAQDTGGAIKGPVRGDFFWGTGNAAGTRAGEMNATGRYYLLLPFAVAHRLAPGDLPTSGD
jgi:membrane-bound lytic murein transglycosylase A